MGKGPGCSQGGRRVTGQSEEGQTFGRRLLCMLSHLDKFISGNHSHFGKGPQFKFFSLSVFTRSAFTAYGYNLIMQSIFLLTAGKLKLFSVTERVDLLQAT